MSKSVPAGYEEVPLGGFVPEGAIYLSTSGHWEPSPCWGFNRGSHARFAVAKPAAPAEPEPTMEDRWDEI